MLEKLSLMDQPAPLITSLFARQQVQNEHEEPFLKQ